MGADMLALRELAIAMIRQALHDAAKWDYWPTSQSPQALRRAAAVRAESISAGSWLCSEAAAPFFDLIGLDQQAVMDRIEEVGIKLVADSVDEALRGRD
jgi:hypothetical protein